MLGDMLVIFLSCKILHVPRNETDHFVSFYRPDDLDDILQVFRADNRVAQVCMQKVFTPSKFSFL